MENLKEYETEEMDAVDQDKKEVVCLYDLAFILSTFLEGKYKVKVSEHKMGYVLRALVDVVRELIKEDKKVRLRGLGVLEPFTYKAKKGFSYLTNKEIYTEEHTIPKFRPSNGFKEYLRFGVKVKENKE